MDTEPRYMTGFREIVLVGHYQGLGFIQTYMLCGNIDASDAAPIDRIIGIGMSVQK